MPRALKVYRTAIGFHDAYVAAPSRAAALRAWGAARDLFATGAAEEVTDPVLMAEPLAQPGGVIRRSRGALNEQLAALGPVPARAAKTEARTGAGEARAGPAPSPAAKVRPEPRSRSRPEPSPDAGPKSMAKPEPQPRPKTKPPPKPSRATLERAERALGAFRQRAAAEVEALRRREAELARARVQLRDKHHAEAERLETRREQAEQDYRARLAAWAKRPG